MAFSLVPTFFVPKVKADEYMRTFSSLANDGYIWETSSSYETARNASTGTVTDGTTSICVSQYYVAFYGVLRGFLMFDTSSIPNNANITSATMSIYIWHDYTDTDFNVTIQNGQPTYPHTPLEVGDYYFAHYTGNGGSRNTTTLPGSGYWNVTLNADGLNWISLTGSTKLSLRNSNEINGYTPTDMEEVEFYALEKGEAYSPKLYITYEYTPAYQYVLYGAYNEEGARDGNISVRFYRPTQETLNFTLDGTNTTDSESAPNIFHFDLGSNFTRVYYVYSSFENIYVFKPTEPFNEYYFTVTDFYGVTNGYLETLINVNGTDRIVERWKLDVLNDIPFTLSWGHTYKLRLVCDQGTHVFGSYVAGGVTSFNLIIFEGMFPRTYPGVNVAVIARRMSATWIQTNYTDSQEITDWVLVVIQYRSGYGWLTAYSTNNTGNSQQINWYDALSQTDYIAKVTASRDGETSTWSFSCGKMPSDNPFEDLLEGLGEWPIEGKYVIGLFMVLAVLGVFSYWSMPLGCILAVMTAAFLNLIGWLNLSWNLIALAFAIGIFAWIGRAKREVREI